MRIAVAVPTFNRDEVLIATLEQLFAQNPPADEVLVIDQSACHLPVIRVRLAQWQAEGRIRHLRQHPANLPAARNRALRETTCEAVIFIDDDVRLMPGFIEAHRRRMCDDPGLAAVAGRVTQPPEAKAPRHGRRRWHPALDYRFLDMDSSDPRPRVAAFMGGNHAIRVARALAIRGYDERFRGIGLREESDMALRLYLAGGAIRYEPAAHLIHLRAPSGGCRPRDAYDTTGGESILYFALKHRRALGLVGFVAEVWLGLRHFLLNRQTLARPDVLGVRLRRLIQWAQTVYH